MDTRPLLDAIKAAFNAQVSITNAANASLNAAIAAGAPELLAVAQGATAVVNALNAYSPLVAAALAALGPAPVTPQSGLVNQPDQSVLDSKARVWSFGAIGPNPPDMLILLNGVDTGARGVSIQLELDDSAKVKNSAGVTSLFMPPSTWTV